MICIPIISKNTEEAIGKMKRAEALADIMEIRLDMMDTFDLKTLSAAASKPLMVTYRSKKEGGRGGADYGTRIRYLNQALEVGASYVDVEYSLPLDYRQKLFDEGNRARLIVSAHLLNLTPGAERLEEILRRLMATGAGIVKIVAPALHPEDNLRILSLIPPALSMGVKIIAFCSGPIGRISRIASLVLGGYLTFASLKRGEESASGQVPAGEMKQILELLRK